MVCIVTALDIMCTVIVMGNDFPVVVGRARRITLIAVSAIAGIRRVTVFRTRRVGYYAVVFTVDGCRMACVVTALDIMRSVVIVGNDFPVVVGRVRRIALITISAITGIRRVTIFRTRRVGYYAVVKVVRSIILFGVVMTAGRRIIMPVRVIAKHVGIGMRVRKNGNFLRLGLFTYLTGVGHYPLSRFGCGRRFYAVIPFVVRYVRFLIRVFAG